MYFNETDSPSRREDMVSAQVASSVCILEDTV